MRSSDILLGDEHGYHPKLSQCGLVEFGQLEPAGAHFLKQYFGFACPDTAMTGNLTAASSLYSFGVVLLELITGRRAFVDQAAPEDRNIVIWVIVHKFAATYYLLIWP
jgi:serine/threonine-protein kinase PBS1